MGFLISIDIYKYVSNEGENEEGVDHILTYKYTYRMYISHENAVNLPYGTWDCLREGNEKFFFWCSCSMGF